LILMLASQGLSANARSATDHTHSRLLKNAPPKPDCPFWLPRHQL
jgi:hypothetical protein